MFSEHTQQECACDPSTWNLPQAGSGLPPSLIWVSVQCHLFREDFPDNWPILKQSPLPCSLTCCTILCNIYHHGVQHVCVFAEYLPSLLECCLHERRHLVLLLPLSALPGKCPAQDRHFQYLSGMNLINQSLGDRITPALYFHLFA